MRFFAMNLLSRLQSSKVAAGLLNHKLLYREFSCHYLQQCHIIAP